ncbi:DUF7301 family protein [Rosenbergiella epipactidis]|uniref:DUF7301 family protein n=1 Tax=Rosenbergiella epipactidis TaxID=1544694 RepID=UPI001F4DDED9|nr:hypothetical protein [Rosenbergiella epipactidis]
MKKLSTTQDLLFHDMNQGRNIFKRYWKSSSLPACERNRNRPDISYRRDRVLLELLHIEFLASIERVSVYSDETLRKAYEDLGLPNPHTA